MKRFLKIWWILSALGEGFLDLIYPSNIYCISCGNIINDSRPYSLCDMCVRSLKWQMHATVNAAEKSFRIAMLLICVLTAWKRNIYLIKGIPCGVHGSGKGYHPQF